MPVARRKKRRKWAKPQSRAITEMSSDVSIRRRRASPRRRACRAAAWKPLVKEIKGSWLKRYQAMATSADTGGVLRVSG